jgi:hypothetical protein
LAEVISKLARLNYSNPAVPDYLLERRLEADERFAELTQQVNSLQNALDFLIGSTARPDSDPNIGKLKERLREPQSQLDARHRELVPKLTASILSEMTDGDSEKPIDRHELKRRQKELQVKLDAYHLRLRQMGTVIDRNSPSRGWIEGLQEDIYEEEKQQNSLQAELDKLNTLSQLVSH